MPMPTPTTDQTPPAVTDTVNWIGLYTLARRETQRFLAIWSQTLLAPLVTAGMFLTIFTLAIGARRADVAAVPGTDIPFIAFLFPGILVMTVIQNAFANSSSSIVVCKVQGNIVDTLMPPLSATELVLGYAAGGVLRGMVVAAAICLVAMPVLGLSVAHPAWALVFVLLGSAFMSGLGIVAGIYANKFDQIAAITNFIVMPLSFLSGAFYSIQVLPPVLQTLSRANPVFYLIDGARYGFIGQSDASPWTGLAVCVASVLVVFGLSWAMFRSGYRLKA